MVERCRVFSFVDLFTIEKFKFFRAPIGNVLSLLLFKSVYKRVNTYSQYKKTVFTLNVL